MRTAITALALVAVTAGTPVHAKVGRTALHAPRPVTVALVPWRNRWVIEGVVAGRTRRFLLDTGAGITAMSKAVLDAAGCVLWGRRTGFDMMGARHDFPHCDGVPVAIGGIALTPPESSAIEMETLNPKDAGLDGIVGLNLFNGRTVTIDFAAGTLTLETDASRTARAAGMQEVPITLKREADGLATAASIGIATSKGRMWFELDSGNGGTILVSKPYAALLGLDPEAAGRQHIDIAVAPGFRAVSDDAFTPDMIMDGNLGMPFLRDKIVMLGLAAERGWIARSPVAPRPATPLPPR